MKGRELGLELGRWREGMESKDIWAFILWNPTTFDSAAESEAIRPKDQISEAKWECVW